MYRLLLALCLCLFPALLRADDKSSEQSLRSAVSRAIPLLEQGSAGSAKERTCFTCHNQALPVIALSEVRLRGFQIDKANFQRQLKHTSKHLERGKDNYLKGKGQGGRIITAGYALRALEAGDYAADEITTAVTTFLLKHQRKLDHWRQSSKRPPTSGSDFTATYVALRGLSTFGSKDQQEDIEKRKTTVRKWLLQASPKETEDHVFRLKALPLVQADKKSIQAAVQDLIEQQRDDGGWSQKADMESDAYATGTVLVALMQAGGVEAESKPIQRGLDYLLRTQLDDGTWRVATRADGFQEYFESGFPHGEDQFISIAASSWSTLALALALPESDAKKQP